MLSFCFPSPFARVAQVAGVSLGRKANLNLEALLMERPSPAPPVPLGVLPPGTGQGWLRGGGRWDSAGQPGSEWVRGLGPPVGHCHAACSPAGARRQGWVGVHGAQPSPPGAAAASRLRDRGRSGVAQLWASGQGPVQPPPWGVGAAPAPSPPTAQGRKKQF